MDLGIRGHVAIVTGGGRGLGAEIAIALAEEGCTVVVWGRSRAPVEHIVGRIKSTGGEAVAVVGDVSRKQTAERIVRGVVKRFGAIHILVNNAGFSQDAPISEMSDEKWSSVLDVCLTGAFLCSRAAIPTMIEQEYGRIINMSSRAHLGEFFKANYSAAKEGIIGLTRALALELGKDGVTVNAVAPGLIHTDRLKSLPNYARMERKSRARTPIQRPGTPRDVADGVLYLASARAGFVTGEVLHITGGRYTSVAG